MPPALIAASRSRHPTLVAPIGSADANLCRPIESSRSRLRSHPNRRTQFGNRQAPRLGRQASIAETGRYHPAEDPMAG